IMEIESENDCSSFGNQFPKINSNFNFTVCDYGISGYHMHKENFKKFIDYCKLKALLSIEPQEIANNMEIIEKYFSKFFTALFYEFKALALVFYNQTTLYTSLEVFKK
ncbi:MAG: hypothetical protein MHPSP_004028, partial [Paramarteilia canceri]